MDAISTPIHPILPPVQTAESFPQPESTRFDHEDPHDSTPNQPNELSLDSGLWFGRDAGDHDEHFRRRPNGWTIEVPIVGA